MGLPAQNICIAGGTDGGKVYLSCTACGKVDLYHRDDGSGRQLWLLQPSNDMRYYHIKVFGGTNRGETYLSCTAGGFVDLYHTDDGSGRQQWVLDEVSGEQDTYHIKPRAGTNRDKTFLSCAPNGLVDLYKEDDGSCRQQWRVQRDELIRLEVFDVPSVLSTKPKYVVKDVFNNAAAAEMTKEFSWTESKTTTDGWDISVGTQFSMAQEVKVGTGAVVPGAESTTNLGLTISFSTTRKWSTSNTEGVAQKYTINIPPHSAIKCSAVITECETTVPLRMIFKSGKEITGSWKGVLQSECKIKAEAVR